MPSQSKRSARVSVVLIAIAFAVGAAALAPQARAWPAGGGGDVTLDDFTITDKDGSKIVIKHIEFTNTNLEKDEIQKLLTPDTPKDQRVALIQKLKADKILMPTIEVTPKKGGQIHLNDFAASDIDEGKVGKLSISGVDGSGDESYDQIRRAPSRGRRPRGSSQGDRLIGRKRQQGTARPPDLGVRRYRSARR